MICVWINGWVNNREAGDLERCRAHYEVSVMLFLFEPDSEINWFTYWYVTQSCSLQCLQMAWQPLRGVPSEQTWLSQWGRNKIATIYQTTFSNAFSGIKMYEFRLIFHWSLFLGFELTIFQHWFGWWLGADQATSQYVDQWWLLYWCIYLSLNLNELTHNTFVIASVKLLFVDKALLQDVKALNQRGFLWSRCWLAFSVTVVVWPVKTYHLYWP